MVDEVSNREAKQYLDLNDGIVVLDVRTPKENHEARIKGSIQVDISNFNFMEKIGKLDKNKKYIVYCRSGSRSMRACEAMVSLGFKQVMNLRGGISEWMEDGLPVEK